MPFLSTMPDTSWTVKVGRWTWIYKFKRSPASNMTGSVSWRDPFNGMHGGGAWKIVGDVMKLTWFNSATTEAWDVPFEPRHTTGQATMKGTTYDVVATANDFYLKPGDVVYSGQPIILGNGTKATIVYENEVRTGGTVAWICCNPGNIRLGDDYGAIKGKYLTVAEAGNYAIFPDEAAGIMGAFKLLRVYGRVTIATAIAKWAPKKDHNKTEEYVAAVVRGMKLPADTYLTAMSDEQVMRMVYVMTGVEVTTKGKAYARGDADMPVDIAVRLH
jgi:hypothetical protein